MNKNRFLLPKLATLHTIVLIAVAFCLVGLSQLLWAQLPEYQLGLENQEIIDGEFHFDIYVYNFGQGAFYLAECDFVLTFDAQYFTLPGYTINLTGTGNLPEYETFTRLILASEEPTIEEDFAYLAVFGPETENESRDAARLEAAIQANAQIVEPGEANGILFAHGIISGISGTVAQANLRWSEHPVVKTGITIYTIKNNDIYLEFIKRSSIPLSANPRGEGEEHTIQSRSASGSGSNIDVFPNPVSDNMTVWIRTAEKKVRLNLVSMNGNRIAEWNVTPKGNAITLALPAMLPPGTYGLRIFDVGGNLLGTKLFQHIR